MRIIPTLNFQGNCREAIKAYSAAFGAETHCLMTYRDANDSAYAALPESKRDCVYHAEISIGGQRINLCDNFDVPPGVCGGNFLTVLCDTESEVRAAYDALKDGSTTIYPMEATFYSACRVGFTDRFGMRWGVLTER